MNRKLLVLNLLLAAVAVFAGFQFHSRRAAAQAREAATLHVKIAPLPPPVMAPLPPAPALVPANYQDAVQQTLFDPSRNPNVVVDAPKPPPPPPVPPALPSYYGSMNIGDGPIAIMSPSTGPQQQVRAGGMIGEFKLLEFDRDKIALAWQGQVIRKRIDELNKRDTGSERAAATGATGSGNRVMPGLASAEPQPAPKLTDLGPGGDSGAANRPCQPGDGLPNGTVQDGYRKVMRPGLVRTICYWEQVGK